MRPVEVRIARNDRPLATDVKPIPGLRSVSIEAAEDGRRATYVVERTGAGDEARTVKDDGTQFEVRAHLPHQDEVELLERSSAASRPIASTSIRSASSSGYSRRGGDDRRCRLTETGGRQGSR